MARKTFDLASVVEAVSDPAEGVRDIEAITAEILKLKQTAGESILGIGQRLIEAKDMLPRGEWLTWLSERVEFSERTAQNFMRLAREWSNPQALADLGATKALTLLALPAEEREQFLVENHVVNGEEKTVIDMTSRELEQAIRERDKLSADNALLQKLQQAAREEADLAKKELEAVRKELKDLQAKPVDVAVMEVDQEKIDAAREKAVTEMQAKVDQAKSAASKAEEKLKATEAALAQANAKLEAAAKAEKRSVIDSDRDLAQFELLFGQAQEIANQLRSLLRKARSKADGSQAAGMQKALTALADLIGKAAEV